MAAKQRFEISEGKFLSDVQHRNLLKYCTDRAIFGLQLRDILATGYETVDKAIGGYKKYSTEDRRRMYENFLKGHLKPVDQNLMLADVQIEDLLTYIMSVMAPDGGFFEAIADKTRQQVAKAFALLMNKMAYFKNYYGEYSFAIESMLKYNLGGFFTEWEEIQGIRLTTAPTGNVQQEETIVWRGNSIKAFDMYNVFWDPTVLPPDVNLYGEYFGTVEQLSRHGLRREKERKIVFGVDEFLKTDYVRNQPHAGDYAQYYKKQPSIRSDDMSVSTGTSSDGRDDGAGTDWVSYMSMGREKGLGIEHELTTMWIRLVPREFGLDRSDRTQVWKFKILNGERIVGAKHLDNAHGMLPCGFALPRYNNMGLQTKSHAMKLIPMQNFASFLMNVHQRAARKALWGITIYNKQYVDMPNAQDDDGYVARIPVRAGVGENNDVAKYVRTIYDSPKTEQTMQDIKAVIELMQYVSPSNSTQQIAGLDRATVYQAAAVKQGNNGRNHRVARSIHSQCMARIHVQLMQNVFQYQERVELIDPEGNVVIADPVQFRDTQIEFDISDGLKGIDRLMVTEGLKEIIGMLLQRPDISKEVNILELINYWSTMVGDRFDLAQFKQQDPFARAGLPPEAKEVAFQMLQQAMQQRAQEVQAQQGALPGPGGETPPATSSPLDALMGARQ